MEAVRDAGLHQGVVSRVELHGVDAKAPGIEGPELRRVLVGEAPKIEASSGAPGRAKGIEPLRSGSLDPVGREGVAERPVCGDQVHVAEGRGLVEDVVGLLVHGAIPPISVPDYRADRPGGDIGIGLKPRT